MIRWLTYFICGVFVCTIVTGCAEEDVSPSTANSQQAKVVAKKPPAKVTSPAAKQEEPKEVEFAYISAGRRDPFVPLSRIKRPVVNDEPETPLQSYDIDQFKLVGVIVGKGDPKAMVVAPDGKSYVLARGVRIGKNNGIIIEINSDVILVEEKYYDYTGNVIENIQEIVVPKRKGA